MPTWCGGEGRCPQRRLCKHAEASAPSAGRGRMWGRIAWWEPGRFLGGRAAHGVDALWGSQATHRLLNASRAEGG